MHLEEGTRGSDRLTESHQRDASPPPHQFAHVRKTQVEQTMDMLEAYGQADGHLLLGDFNMRDVDREGNERLDETYVDLWQAAHGPIEPGRADGFTFDLAKNDTARLISTRVTAIKRTTGRRTALRAAS